MLARSPIRTKLLLALAILTAMVTTMAFSGFWGLYRYRQLANNVSQRAAEIPQTNALIRSVDILRESCRRIEEVRFQRAILGSESPLSSSILKSESEQFDNALREFSSVMDRYKASLANSPSEDILFADPQRQQFILSRIDLTLQQIKDIQRRPVQELEAIDFATLQLELDALYHQTQKLPAFLQMRMANVRDEVKGQYRTWIGVAWFCTILAVTMLGVLLWLFRTLVVQPFRTLLDGCRLVAGGQFNHHIELGTGDELDELGQAMNGMTMRFQQTCTELEEVCDDLDRQVRERTREVIQREQLASVGFLAAGVAHEINNPLASIAWSAEALESRLHDALHGTGDTRSITAEEAETLRKNLSRIQDEAFRCKGITERLLDFSRLGNVNVAPTDIGTLVEDVVSMVGTLGQYRCKSIRVDCPETVVASINAQEIRQVVLNLLTNALESVPSDGQVRVSIRKRDQQASISVADNGCGMTEEVRDHLFEPFFTRRKDGHGTGLGLSITYRIICKHGGLITAHSDGVGRGSRLEVTLPLEPVENQHGTSQAA
ncbi:sensor histidine kinase [Roseimaritima ulvae]|uniref:histidine kinase n=1 Tax=Roseimaritima ulvae TaxID=980254 RepID=A0A5B9R8Y2_9BACT|nr:HAMP domain-containing sensor histidine kinase [Roseimaritima ulvae]QEG43351.1 C4-dicarboxylate transport sensor protein DctB [Roseimaritima ulvae]